MLRRAYTRGAEDAFKKHGLAQPSLQAVGIKSPVKAPGLPGAATAPVLKTTAPTDTTPSLGIAAAKVGGIIVSGDEEGLKAFFDRMHRALNHGAPMPDSIGEEAAKAAADVGLGYTTAGTDAGSGAVRGEPADEGRRQQSVIDRTFQANEDNFSTSAMPAPGGSVSP